MTTTPLGTTHIRKFDAPCYDGLTRPKTMYYRVTSVKFSNGKTSTKIEYYNYDFDNWQGCVNSYAEVLRLIQDKDNTITEVLN